MQFLTAATRAAIPRFDHPRDMSHDESVLEDVRLAILSGTFIEGVIDVDDEDMPLAGRITLIAEPETPQ